MNQLGQGSLTFTNYARPDSSGYYPHENWRLTAFEVGGVIFIEVEVWNNSVNRKTGGAVFEFKQGHQRVELHDPSPVTAAKSSESLVEVLGKLMDFKKDDKGVWVPRVKAGDLVVVDSPGGRDFKILDVESQCFDRLPKKAIEVADKPCTCPFTTLMSTGCACGGMRIKAGLSELAKEAS